MALKDMMKGAASQAVSSAKDAAQAAIDRDRSQAQAQGIGGVVSGIMGSYSEMPLDAIERDYGMYLMDGERFDRGFALLRDKMLFTDRRIVFIDHQGATGKKTAVESIWLDSIIDVRLETGGMGFDRAEIDFSYITSPYYRGHSIETASKHLEFPNGFDVRPLYTALEGRAWENLRRINS